MTHQQAAGMALFITGFGLIGGATGLLSAFEQLAVVRLIEDLPTARVRSASQGYVELRGRVQRASWSLKCPSCGASCYWYQYPTRQGKKTILHTPPGGKGPPVVIDDGTGLCRVEMAGVTLLSARTAGPDHIHVHAGDPLHVLGEFRTHANRLVEQSEPGQPTLANRVDELNRRLKALKADRARMALFDVNRDGDVDFREWEAARRATEARLDREIAQAPPPVMQAENRIGPPRTDADRLPYVVVVGSEQDAIRAARAEFARRFVGAGVIAAFVGVFGLLIAAGEFDHEAPRFSRASTAPVRPATPRPTPTMAQIETRARADGEFRHALERDQELVRQGRWGEIIDLWDTYLRTHPNDARAYYERGGARHHAGQRDEALADVRRSCELGFQHACGMVERVAR